MTKGVSLQGITTFTASGDDGSRDDPQDLTGQLLNVDYPSSSPYAFGCGGTTITPECVPICCSSSSRSTEAMHLEYAWFKPEKESILLLQRSTAAPPQSCSLGTGVKRVYKGVNSNIRFHRLGFSQP